MGFVKCLQDCRAYGSRELRRTPLALKQSSNRSTVLLPAINHFRTHYVLGQGESFTVEVACYQRSDKPRP